MRRFYAIAFACPVIIGAALCLAGCQTGTTSTTAAQVATGATTAVSVAGVSAPCGTALVQAGAAVNKSATGVLANVLNVLSVTAAVTTAANSPACTAADNAIVSALTPVATPVAAPAN